MIEKDKYVHVKALAATFGLTLSALEPGFVSSSPPPEVTKEEYMAAFSSEPYVPDEALSSRYVKLDADGKPVKRD